MEKARMSVKSSEGYEISIGREELSVDLCRFFYGDADTDDAAEEGENEMSAAEQGAFLKSACLLFGAAVAIVMTLLLI